MAPQETPVTVPLPADLYAEIKRISANENWPESKAVLMLAKLGAKSQKKMEAQFHSAYEAFMSESDPKAKDQLGDEMIRSIFGPEALG